MRLFQYGVWINEKILKVLSSLKRTTEPRVHCAAKDENAVQVFVDVAMNIAFVNELSGILIQRPFPSALERFQSCNQLVFGTGPLLGGKQAH
jgi:hypothetical protein